MEDFFRGFLGLLIFAAWLVSGAALVLLIAGNLYAPTDKVTDTISFLSFGIVSYALGYVTGGAK